MAELSHLVLIFKISRQLRVGRLIEMLLKHLDLDSNITVIHQSKRSANFSLGTLECGQTALRLPDWQTGAAGNIAKGKNSAGKCA